MKVIILIAALGLATPAWAQQAQPEPAPRPLPPESFHWDSNQRELKAFQPPSSVTINGVEHSLTPPKPGLPLRRDLQPEKKPEKSVG
jgi:hypothetical protein